MEERCYQIGGLCIRMSGCAFRENTALASFRTEKPMGTVLSYESEVVDEIVPPALPCVRQEGFETHYSDGTQTFRLLLRDGSKKPILSEQTVGSMHRVRLAREALPLWDSNLAMKLWRLQEKLLELNETFLHASMIAIDGKAILFTAQKQVGKSTQAALWEQYRGAEVINGDRALLRQKDGAWYACGSPYCGTSGICKQGQFPLAAVVILHQARENSVRPALARETAAAFLDGCTFDSAQKAQTEKILDTALSIFSAVPVLTLSCLPDRDAVHCLAEALKL